MCLLDHETELSPACLEAVKTAHAIEVCTPDYRQYCDGAKGQQALECLAGRMESLQPGCRRIVAANAPYMNRRPGRFAYGGPGPYGMPGPAPYPYRGGQGDEERYEGEGGPNGPYGTYPYPSRPGPYGAIPYSGRPGPDGPYPYAGRPGPYGGYPYAGRPGPDGAYSYPGRPAPDGAQPDAGRPAEPGEHYTGEDERRFRSYDERYAGRFGPDRNYDKATPGEREGADEERE
jgi:hypothetical protein